MKYSNRILIIAEVGINHNGSILKAKKMIDIAKESGADYVKFQIFKPHNLAIEKAKLQIIKKNSKVSNQVELLHKYKLNFSILDIYINTQKQKK